jgi:hypothetical protein
VARLWFGVSGGIGPFRVSQRLAPRGSTIRRGVRDTGKAASKAPEVLGLLGPLTWIIGAILVLFLIIEAFIWPWQAASGFAHLNHTSPWAYAFELYAGWIGSIAWCIAKYRERQKRSRARLAAHEQSVQAERLAEEELQRQGERERVAAIRQRLTQPTSTAESTERAMVSVGEIKARLIAEWQEQDD